jgi:GLPGLI family protein
MKHKSILLIMAIVASQNFIAQTVTVNYIEKKNIPQEKLAQLPPQVVQMLNKEVKCTLVNSQGNSLFQFQEENTGNLQMNISLPKREEYYKQLASSKMLRLSFLEDEKFIVTDELPKIDWKIAPETLTIGQYNCQKATTLYKGTEIVAWFTSSIALSDGPLMLTGLPGLIIKVSINNMLIYEVAKITISKENTTIAPFTAGKVISVADFEKLKAKLAAETLARQKEAGATHIEVK